MGRLGPCAASRPPCSLAHRLWNKDANTPLMVGLVGYPNVGKSSTINAILGCKKVVVSATPGKTKHFQTLVIPNERRVALCDCPGLVFPSFASTREQMVCDGILPIDTATDALSAVNVLCRRIPREVLQKQFGVSLRLRTMWTRVIPWWSTSSTHWHVGVVTWGHTTGQTSPVPPGMC
ncbi:hypothetical protein C4B63_128g62 [Trypanosoma cruzi]|uniref:G domain-containing protein n=1 Tax=Trypanosoma cruzi TaxID=5693 RepID=A0A2V2UQE0_TRYCR|nr:hypothetical protein C4B63_128g62 [Trypanosoma cruzi]